DSPPSSVRRTTPSLATTQPWRGSRKLTRPNPNPRPPWGATPLWNRHVRPPSRVRATRPPSMSHPPPVSHPFSVSVKHTPAKSASVGISTAVHGDPAGREHETATSESPRNAMKTGWRPCMARLSAGPPAFETMGRAVAIADNAPDGPRWANGGTSRESLDQARNRARGLRPRHDRQWSRGRALRLAFHARRQSGDGRDDRGRRDDAGRRRVRRPVARADRARPVLPAPPARAQIRRLH